MLGKSQAGSMIKYIIAAREMTLYRHRKICECLEVYPDDACDYGADGPHRSLQRRCERDKHIGHMTGSASQSLFFV